MTPERRHNRAKKNTVETPVSTNAHHCQLPATPNLRTCSVTQFGVSLLNVVATIDKPASHQGTDRPDAKNSDVFFPARLPKNKAGTKQMSSETRTMTQSTSWMCMAGGDYALRRILHAYARRERGTPVGDVPAADARPRCAMDGASSARTCRARCRSWSRTSRGRR